MRRYNVTGMGCAACQARVEKAVSAVPGVSSCAVSLLTNSMGVEGDAEPAAVIAAVEDAGYGAALAEEEEQEEGEADPSQGGEALEDTETPRIRNRLIASVVLLLPLMYIGMGSGMRGWPLPGFLADSPVAAGICEMILAGLVMVINRKFFISGLKGLLHRAPNMDTLVAMGAAASYIYSLCVLIAMAAGQAGGGQGAAAGAHGAASTGGLYFESAAMILTLITVGKLLESVSKGRTTDALKELMRLSPKTAVLLRDGAEEEVPVEQVKTGDRFVVRPGQNIPVDGIVVEGNGAVNESALTGESIPVDKEAGDPVSAATVNENGYLVCEATRVGKDTALAQIIDMVSDAAATKAPIAKIADRVSGIFVPAVIAIALITFVIWIAVGQTVGFALARAISVLVISCPCALGLATPVAIMVGNGVGARNGILFKTAESLEAAGKTRIMALDKTGTITKGEPEVIEVHGAEGVSEEELIRAALALEARSEHPIAKAITAFGSEAGMKPEEVTGFRTFPGNGLTAMADGKRITGGNRELIEQETDIPGRYIDMADSLADQGQTPVFFAEENRILGILSVADVIKEDSPEAIGQLKKMGIRVVMLTGDNPRTAQAIAGKAGVDEAEAGVRPEEKGEIIGRLRQQGSVAMVGDGINDAPALTGADIGIAIGAGTDVAIDAADVVLMKSRLTDAAAAVRLSRATLRNIHENLFWAFFYNVLGIPLAAGAFIHAFGWTLNPMIAAAAMALSSFCVVTNALRLNAFKLYNGDRDRAPHGQ